MPLEKIAHELMNEPWCYSWDEVQNIPLNALVLIWTKPQEPTAFSQADADEALRKARERKRREREGIWYQGDGGT